MRKKLIEEAPHLEIEWMIEKNDRTFGGITGGSKYEAWWECESCNNQWKAIVQNRVKGTRCPKCAKSRKKIH